MAAVRARPDTNSVIRSRSRVICCFNMIVVPSNGVMLASSDASKNSAP